MPIFCQLNLEFGKRYKNDVRVIFDQWLKLNLRFDVEPEIRILKVNYCISLLTFCGLSGAWTPMGVWMGFLLVVAGLQDQILISKSFYISPVVSYLIYEPAGQCSNSYFLYKNS